MTNCTIMKLQDEGCWNEVTPRERLDILAATYLLDARRWGKSPRGKETVSAPITLTGNSCVSGGLV